MPPSKKEIAVGFASATAIFLMLFAAGLTLLEDPLLSQAITFSITAGEIVSFYPLPVARHAAFDGAERALLSLLDPFSYRIDEKEYGQLREESSGQYGGVGITVAPRDTTLMVLSVREGGPAYEGGMKAGDLILSVDGKKVLPDNPGAATGMIRGPSGSAVSLIIYRPKIADTLHLTLIRSSIRLEHLPYYGLTESGIAYIRMADFEAGAAEELEDAVDSLERQRPRGYIIDLMGNPGGFLNEAVRAAGVFLDKGMLIVGTAGRPRWDDRRYIASSTPLTDLPIVILTDRGTASAAEIFTGALGGAQRAAVIGDTTFGKGLVQSMFSLTNGDAVRLTTSRYYFADGTFLNPPDSDLTFSGLPPDIVFVSTGEISFEEKVLSGFLIFDFVESEADLLASYPDKFVCPDTVITLFEKFARGRGFAYRSWLTEILEQTIVDQKLNQASPGILSQLENMASRSVELDQRIFQRQADMLKYHIRLVAIERKLGAAAAYRDVIVPGRPDIRLAEEVLSDPSRYQSFLAHRAEK